MSAPLFLRADVGVDQGRRELLVSLVGGDSYHVTLTPEHARILTGWCREAAEGASFRDGAVLRVTAVVIEAAS